MARLPQPGGDSGNWGDILNEYLAQSLKANGTIKDNAVTASAIAPNAVTSSSLAPNSVTSTALAADSVNAVTIADGSITEMLLAPAVQTKLNTSPTVADGSITTSKLADGAVTTVKLTDTAVTEAKLATAVQTKLNAPANIADGSLTKTKLETGVQTSLSKADSALQSADLTPTEKTANKGQANGYAALDTNSKVPTGQLGSGTANATTYLRGDGSWAAGASAPDASSSVKGIVQLSGDLAGTATALVVAKVNGVTVTGTPAANQVLTATSATAANWATASSSGAQALVATSVKTTAYTASAADLIPADASSGAMTITLPTAPVDKSRVVVKKIDTSTNTITITVGGSDVFNKTGGSTSISLSLQNQSINLQYSSAASIWYAVGSDTPLSQLDLRYPLNTATIASGDLTGTYAAPIVTKVNGITVSGTPVGGQVLSATSTNTASWSNIGLPTPRVTTVAYTATITPNAATTDILDINPLTGNVTIANPTNTPPDGQMLKIRFAQDTTGGRTISFGSAYVFGTDVTTSLMPSAANVKWIMLFGYNAADAKWRALAIARGF